MTHDRNLLVPARAALNFICYAQDPNGGGWRYQPREKGDTSMLGWQLMALKSGHMAESDRSASNLSQGVAVSRQRAERRRRAVRLSGRPTRGPTPPWPSACSAACISAGRRTTPRCSAACSGSASAAPRPATCTTTTTPPKSCATGKARNGRTGISQMRDQLIHSQAKQGHEEGSWFTRRRRPGRGDRRPPLLHRHGRHDPRSLLPPHAHLPHAERRAGLPRLADVLSTRALRSSKSTIATCPCAADKCYAISPAAQNVRPTVARNSDSVLLFVMGA